MISIIHFKVRTVLRDRIFRDTREIKIHRPRYHHFVVPFNHEPPIRFLLISVPARCIRDRARVYNNNNSPPRLVNASTRYAVLPP